MRTLLGVSRFIDTLNEWMGRFAVITCLLMVVVGFWNVVARYIGQYLKMNLASNSLIEGQWYLFTIVFLFGAAYTLRRNEHVRVDVVYMRLNDRQKAWVNLLGSLLFLIPFCIIVIEVSIPWLSFSWKILEMSSDPGGLPRYPLKTILPIAFGLLALQGVSEAIKSLAFLRGVHPQQQKEHGNDTVV